MVIQAGVIYLAMFYEVHANHGEMY
jgi:hypothetical protein